MPRIQPSKSKRIQDYFRTHPGARNRDVIAALSDHGVTPADVSNAKSQMRRKLRQPARGSSVIDAPVLSAVEATADPQVSISLVELEAAVEFVRTAGGLSRAQQLLVLLQQIKSLYTPD